MGNIFNNFSRQEKTLVKKLDKFFKPPSCGGQNLDNHAVGKFISRRSSSGIKFNDELANNYH